jgi:uracil DNA glycosylase
MKKKRKKSWIKKRKKKTWIKKKNIPEDKVLISAHPAAEMYNFGRAGFFGNGHFVKINEMLDSKINWFTLPTQLTDNEQIQLYND